MFVTAKLTGKIKAIKLTEDLMAERGDYILFDENDGITILSEAEFRRFFSASDTKIPLLAKPKRASPNSVKKLRGVIDPNGAIVDPARESPFKRVILSFGPDVSGRYLEELTVDKIVDISGLLKTQVTPAVSDLTKNGYLNRKYINSKLFRYSLTDAGRMMNVKIRRVAMQAAKKNPD